MARADWTAAEDLGVARLRPAAPEVAPDLDALAALEATFGPDRASELVEDALARAVERLVAVERALDEEDWTRMARAARELAALAARIGLPPLAAQAEALADCCACLDRTAAHAVAGRLLLTGEAALCGAGLRR